MYLNQGPIDLLAQVVEQRYNTQQDGNPIYRVLNNSYNEVQTAVTLHSLGKYCGFDIPD